MPYTLEPMRNGVEDEIWILDPDGEYMATVLLTWENTEENARRTEQAELIVNALNAYRGRP